PPLGGGDTSRPISPRCYAIPIPRLSTSSLISSAYLTVAQTSSLRTSGHSQHLSAVEMMPPRRLPARATGSACSPT
ncbi:MAG TPA: hypothetical protein DEF43_17015, partial [Chloroflexus aurantiacus]|nr:hypothetical protein [Chloroflexus aurantiacus]